MVRQNRLPHCNITPDAIKRANNIFGPNLIGIRGKTTRRRPEKVRNKIVQILTQIIQQNRLIWLAADVIFVKRIAFVVAVSRGLKFITTHNLPSRETNNLVSSIKETIKIYQRGGFKVQIILMDREFEKIKPHLPELLVNTTSAGEHVGKVERHIRTIKERTRGIM
ncbi:hypothetical protein ACHAXS_000163, partial [Conticribra weissflogii]